MSAPRELLLRPVGSIFQLTGPRRRTPGGLAQQGGVCRFGDFLAAENLVLGVDHLEQLGRLAHRFRRAQEQNAPGTQRVMEVGQHVLLGADVQVDQNVAADDQVQPRKWRI